MGHTFISWTTAVKAAYTTSTSRSTAEVALLNTKYHHYLIRPRKNVVLPSFGSTAPTSKISLTICIAKVEPITAATIKPRLRFAQHPHQKSILRVVLLRGENDVGATRAVARRAEAGVQDSRRERARKRESSPRPRPNGSRFRSQTEEKSKTSTSPAHEEAPRNLDCLDIISTECPTGYRFITYRPR